MTVYPVLQVQSLVDRCKQDITTFTEAFPDKSNPINYSLCIEADYGTMMAAITTRIATMNGILATKNKNITNFDYAHHILDFTEQERNQLWMIRTLLCYQMMIFGTHVMSNELLHTRVYQTSPFQRTFRTDVVEELPSFKLGIFGSITPTSDIDIGIQYSGKTPEFIALAYVVGIIEDMFIHFLGITSTLKLDIEYYANLETVPNPDIKNTASPDLFYLDTTHFTENDFNAMLPYAYASIYRNYLTAIKDLETEPNWTDFMNRLQGKGVDVNKHHITKDAMALAKKMVDEYMGLSYNKAREKYYTLVRKAEELVNVIRGFIRAGNYDAITNDMILHAMIALAHSLIFRAESYTCAPTVMHVVRLLQASTKNGKYPVTYPIDTCAVRPENRLKNPQCGIGWFGYEMSILEQIGYIIRFAMMYCEQHMNAKAKANANANANANAKAKAKAKCDKKQLKYETRRVDGKKRQEGVPLFPAIKQNNGGRRIRRRTRQRTRRNIRKKQVRHTKRHMRR
jgi:hypothetical protein